MAHPKRKQSKTRRDKRRTHYKASTQQLATCPTTGETHLYHRAHWSHFETCHLPTKGPFHPLN